MKITNWSFCVLLIAAIGCNCIAQQNDGVTKKIREINRYYNEFYKSYDTTILNYISETSFFLRDHTLGINLKSKGDLRNYLKSSAKLLPNTLVSFKSEIKDFFYITPYVVDVHGLNSGIHEGVKFSTPFTTVMMFDDNLKLIGWTDHVDPKTFSGGSSKSGRNKKVIREFYKGYSAIDTTYISKYCSKDLKLVDPTMKLEMSEQDLKRAWVQSRWQLTDIKVTLSDFRVIAENVIDVNGQFDFTVRQSSKKVKTPFSTVFILKDKKIIHWVDHFDKNAFVD